MAVSPRVRTFRKKKPMSARVYVPLKRNIRAHSQEGRRRHTGRNRISSFEIANRDVAWTQRSSLPGEEDTSGMSKSQDLLSEGEDVRDWSCCQRASRSRRRCIN